MPLFERLIDTHDPAVEERIPVHYFIAGIREVIRGKFSLAQLRAAFNIPNSGQDLTDMNALIGWKDDAETAGNVMEFPRRLDDALLLAEAGLAYTTRAAMSNRMSDAYGEPI